MIIEMHALYAGRLRMTLFGTLDGLMMTARRHGVIALSALRDD